MYQMFVQFIHRKHFWKNNITTKSQKPWNGQEFYTKVNQSLRLSKYTSLLYKDHWDQSFRNIQVGMVNLVSVEVVNPRVSVGAGLLAGGELAVLGSLVVQHAPELG